MDISPESTPAQILRALYALQDRLTSPGSMSGHQADRLRSGLGGAPQDGGRVNGQEALHAKLGDLLLLCRGLTSTEERVCRLRYGAAAGSVTYEALRRVGDLHGGDGEEVIDVRPNNLDGRPLSGEWVRVRGRRARLPSCVEIAKLLADQGVLNADGVPMTAGAVKRALCTASEKVAFAIRTRAGSGRALDLLSANRRPEGKIPRR